MGALHSVSEGRCEQQLELPEVPALSDREQTDALHMGLVSLLTRGRPAFGQCKAKRIVDESFGEMTMDELNAITDAARDEAERHLTGRDVLPGRKAYVYDVLMGLVIRYAKTCVDMDKAEALYRESCDE